MKIIKVYWNKKFIIFKLVNLCKKKIFFNDLIPDQNNFCFLNFIINKFLIIIEIEKEEPALENEGVDKQVSPLEK